MRLFLLVLIFSFFFFNFNTSGRPYYFRHYTNDNGLPNNTVTACIQDHRGFVWFGTKEGLTRYDGFHFRVFVHNPTIPNSLPDNYITSLCEDKDGLIWIGTTEGICYYNPENDLFGSIGSDKESVRGMIMDMKADNSGNIWISTFTGIYRFDKIKNSLNFYHVRNYFIALNIDITNSGDVWFSAYNGMVYKYDPTADDFVSYRVLSANELASSVQVVNIIDAGSSGFILVTSNSGLRQFDPNTGEVSKIFKDDENLMNLSIRTACMNDEELWLGTETGIHIYNLRTGFVTNLKTVGTDPFSISNNAIRTITKDREGGIWVGTFYGGVNYLPQENKPFMKYYPTGLPGSLTGDVVREIKADSYGNIWMGTEDAGLIMFDPKKNVFKGFFDKTGPGKIDSRNIQGLLIDDDDLWIGTYDNGIYIMDIPTETIRHHFVSRSANYGLNTDSFITFLKSEDGTIYAGSISGLYRYDSKNSKFRLLENITATAFIHCLFEDQRGNIWIGTYGRGLYKYDRKTDSCKKITVESNSVNEFITSVFEDNLQRVWITTEGDGFSFIDGYTGEVTRYIPGKDIDFAIYCAMLQDEYGNLWITSTRGLLRIDKSLGNIVTYTKEDGLLNNCFSYNSAYRDEKGRMYFGTTSGLLSFYPGEIKENTNNNPVYLTGFQVNGRDYFVNAEGQKDFRSLLTTDKISLKHNQSSLSIDFVSPGYNSPGLTKYKYKMEGSDQDWVLISGNRRVYYTNLSPGDYRFRVISSSDGDNWNSGETILDIKISPPIWLSTPAIILYIVFSALTFYTLISFYIKKNALEHQRKIDIIETNKEKEILNAKINFFTTITHEVRTPLTLIKGPLDRILRSGFKNIKDTEENLLIIKRSTDRLLNLINQLLDFRKTEKEMFRLNFIRTDLYELVESTYNLFLPLGVEKMLSVKLHSPVNHYDLAVDREAVTKIISNLLSNALKYARSNVDVFIEPVTEKENIIRVRVNNDGNLIPGNLSEKIFEPFFQIDFDTHGEKGAGLGLSLARSLAELHHGRLYLDTGERRFNSFVLELTKDQSETIMRAPEKDEVDNTSQREFEIFGSLEISRPNILLVEDEIEMGRFIARELSGDYNIILTCNGDEALRALKEYNVTLVVSDVLMPFINGYELCRNIKSDIEFSHIPVILLTATIHLNARIEGLDSGADAYIEKPFTTDLLLAQINNLIKNRSLERQNFINTPLAHFKSVAVNKTDEDFLKKLHSTILENISEKDMSVERIATLMGMSVSTLYRKVKGLTDLNTVEYVRLIRLKKAAELLSEGNYRINEISYLIGFSSPSYFATSFQKQFGISPSQFIRSLKMEN